ncbi:helix-turn-helix domain-containing protein [Tumidithrix elongata RA019]|uniref:Helix-turn-helix domain-containing protein n=1 Tax=Tumidithrix elongata BACA0141 TaxID=2716417 RepID=A0AAW9Q5T5_9CYAN|nr:helix-turn-helix domain-containing protein [Tumidithrix elongata RA019]
MIKRTSFNLVNDKYLQEVASAKSLQKQLENNSVMPKLVGSDGQEVAIPEAVFAVLQKAVQLMASGKKISILPSDCELTPQQAADILNVSRPFFMGLLQDRVISSQKVGTHHRIRLQDVVDYKKSRDSERKELLDELIQMGEEEGFYEV